MTHEADVAKKRKGARKKEPMTEDQYIPIGALAGLLVISGLITIKWARTGACCGGETGTLSFVLALIGVANMVIGTVVVGVCWFAHFSPAKYSRSSDEDSHPPKEPDQ